MNQFNTKNKKNQDWQKKDCWPADFITKDPYKYFLKFHSTKTNLINIIIGLWNKNGGTVFVLQRILGKWLGICRQRVNEILGELEDLGILIRHYRHMRSCLFKLSSWFMNPYVASALSPILKAIRTPLLYLMFSNQVSEAINQTKTTRIKERKIYLFTDNSQQQGYSNRNSLSTKRIVKMNAEISIKNPISIAIRELTCISLSKWGQIRLSVFPDAAILYAAENFKYGYKLKNAFGFFFQLCQDYCKNNKIQPDWQYSQQLAVKYKMPENAVMLIEKKESKAPETVVKNLHQQSVKRPAEWNGPEQRRYGPAKPFYHEYPNMGPEQKAIAEKSFAEQKKLYDSYQANKHIDKSMNFLSGCQLDHKKEFEVFFSLAGVENLYKQYMLLGEKVAKDLFANMIDQHEQCLKTNHGGD